MRSLAFSFIRAEPQHGQCPLLFIFIHPSVSHDCPPPLPLPFVASVKQKQLVEQKIHIEENEDRDTGLEQRHYKEDADCVMAKVPLGDLDLYDGTYVSLESKDIG